MLFVLPEEKFALEPPYNEQMLLSVIWRCPLLLSSICIVIIMYIGIIILSFIGSVVHRHFSLEKWNAYHQCLL